MRIDGAVSGVGAPRTAWAGVARIQERFVALGTGSTPDVHPRLEMGQGFSRESGPGRLHEAAPFIVAQRRLGQERHRRALQVVEAPRSRKASTTIRLCTTSWSQ